MRQESVPRRPSRSRGSRVLRATAAIVGILVLGAGVLGGSRIVVVALATPDRSALAAAQVRHLTHALDHGAATDSQALFPEGYLLTYALSALALAAPANSGDSDVEKTLREWLAAIDSPAGVGGMQGPAVLPNGAFHAGWSLLVATELARVSGDESDAREVRERATRILQAVSAEPTGFIESYSGRRWPVDTVIAWGAVRRADARVGLGQVMVPEGTTATVDDAVADWLVTIDPTRDPDTGLLPHEVSATGSALDNVRGSSQSLIQVFWPDVVGPDSAATDYAAFVDAFVVRRWGLVGTAEFPAHGPQRPGDIDSGPLISGVSTSASAVTLAAAVRHGDEDLANSIDREAEIFGVPVPLDSRTYLFGLLPVGDAFLAWARTQEAGNPAANSHAPDPLLGLWATFAFATAALGPVGLRRIFLRRRASFKAERDLDLIL